MTTGLNPPESPNDSDRVYPRQETERERQFHCEQLSAMMDGTLSTDESRFLLRRMQHDAELAGRWERWQLYGDAMRGQTGNALPADFSRRVSRAIAAEAEAERAAQSAALESAAMAATAASGGPAVAWRQRLRWGGGAALAASVVIAALVSTRDLSQDPGSSAAAVATAPVISSDPVPGIPTTGIPAPSASPAEGRQPRAVTALAAQASNSAFTPNETPRQMANIGAISSDEPGAAAASAAPRMQVASASNRIRRDARPASRAAAVDSQRNPVLAAQTPVSTATTDPFGRQPLDLSAKPWPRALLPESASVGGVTVDYSVGGGHGVHPSFQPRVEAAGLAPAATDSAPPPSESPAP